jgi:hypothetical protein
MHFTFLKIEVMVYLPEAGRAMNPEKRSLQTRLKKLENIKSRAELEIKNTLRRLDTIKQMEAEARYIKVSYETMRECVRASSKCWVVCPVSDPLDEYQDCSANEIGEGCWYGRNMDRLGELREMYKLDLPGCDTIWICDVCYCKDTGMELFYRMIKDDGDPMQLDPELFSDIATDDLPRVEG